MSGIYEHLIVGFGILKFFVLTKIRIDSEFEAVHAEVDIPGKFQKYGASNMKKQNRSRGAWKRDDCCKKKKWMKNQPFVSESRYNWFHHTDIITCFTKIWRFHGSKQLFKCFPGKILIMVCYSLLDY